MAHTNPVPKLYKSVIEDVIEGVRELFAEEGLEEQVLQDLKQRWETKVVQSKATEGFFKNSHHSQRFTLQLPQNLHRVLQASTASFVIPTARGFQHFAAVDPGASRAGATLTHPSGVAYPVHVPAGVMLQTTSGHLYKVNVPVVVTQTPGDVSILHHPVQQMYQPLGQPSVLQANIASAAQVNASSAEILQPQDTVVQHSMVFQPNVMEKNNLENSANTSLVQQPSVSQQQLATNVALNQCADSTEKSQHGSLHTAVFTPESSKGFSLAESLANNSSSVLLDVEEQLDIQLQESVHQQVSDDIIDLIIMGNSLDDGAVLKDEDRIASSDKMEPTVQMKSNLRSEKDICSDIEGIIQLDGTGDASPKKEIPHAKDRGENEFVGVTESEDLKVLDDEDDEECGSISDTESSSNGGDKEEPQIDIVEEDPLNSGDDVSEQDIPDLFDTDNLIVCQYDKIHRSKNKWKFYLKDGVMSFEGKDHVFSKAIGDAEW
ncbi:TFIIA-alpha and beta-like factor [Strigops habroptila]|uniref:TFIIA-alpha and beta-like factor n=1 Tax=Strigops habroptila TaxID=2489341 RepID=UPI0011CFEF38|nr:TFIIA-alpha and beta-like factor [Strigops habroptila]